MPIHDRFQATTTARLPIAYLLSNSEQRVVRLLKRHGVHVQTAAVPGVATGEKLRLDTVDVHAQPAEGHCMVSITGHVEEMTITVPSGSYLVLTAQPLGTLAAHLLEPEGLDGVTAWGLLETPLAQGETHPIAKLYSSVLAPDRRR